MDAFVRVPVCMCVCVYKSDCRGKVQGVWGSERDAVGNLIGRIFWGEAGTWTKFGPLGRQLGVVAAYVLHVNKHNSEDI